jgi:hypothetical protein
LAYLPEFKNDLFISYRRAINEGPDRWVSSFQKALHLSLKQLVGDKVVIWRDEEQLHTGDNWRDKLVEALESAAIYLAIISRTYLESRECRNELDLMLAMLRADLGKRQHRIFPVYVHPPRSGADVPAELQGTHHREFFERRDDAPLGFSELDARPDCLEFQQRLARLAQEVTVALERLRDDSSPTSSRGSTATATTSVPISSIAATSSCRTANISGARPPSRTTSERTCRKHSWRSTWSRRRGCAPRRKSTRRGGS